MRHTVEGESDLAAPGMLDLDPGELRVDADHRCIEPVACLPDRGRGKASPATEEHPVVGAEPPVIQEVLRVEEHPPARDRTVRQVGRQRLGGDDVAADRNDPTPDATEPEVPTLL